jgi:bifunctional DNase/RNase
MSEEPTTTEEVPPVDESTEVVPSETKPQDVPYQVMHFEAVLYDLTDASPMVHLVESASPFRFVVIPIALSDGIALQHAYSAVESRRPGTHELMTTILTRLQAEVVAARIVRVEGGVYYAELDLMTPKGREVFDCRASDALSMALRQRVQAPILCSEDVLQAYLA